MNNSHKHRFTWFAKNYRLMIGAIVALILCMIALDNRLLVRKYTLDTEKIASPIIIALITDLHSCYYGENQMDLIEAVHKQLPDIVLLGGDIFDDDLSNENTEKFLADIARQYPCYYVTGNHEYWSGTEGFREQMETLERYGVTILSNECETVFVGNEYINLCGVEDPEAYAMKIDSRSLFIEQLERVDNTANNEHFTLLLSHRPEFFDTYAQCDFDLVLCGHAHGGQWRIPLLLNGLFAPNQGLFPKYAGGQYEQNDTVMLVSRGLARESTRLPRIFNRPELVMVEIK